MLTPRSELRNILAELDLSALSALNMLELHLRAGPMDILEEPLKSIHGFLKEKAQSCSISLALPIHLLFSLSSISTRIVSYTNKQERYSFNALAELLEQRTKNVTFILGAQVAHNMVEKIHRMLRYKLPTLTAKKLLQLQVVSSTPSRYGRTNIF